jgi:SAM-dependent methyltransferase
MKTPWETVSLDDYETHMASEQVGQLQALSEIMRRQLLRHAPESVCVLGVAGGNGLEHIGAGVRKVYGIDISVDYLEVCRQRFAYFGDRLELLRADLTDDECRLPQADLVIADLVIEYVGVETFAQRVDESRPVAICCAVQRSRGASFVSASPAAQALQCLDPVHRDVDAETLAEALARIGYRQIFREDCPLPGGKELVCLDFER